jgi:hypothetical protein
MNTGGCFHSEIEVEKLKERQLKLEKENKKLKTAIAIVIKHLNNMTLTLETDKVLHHLE